MKKFLQKETVHITKILESKLCDLCGCDMPISNIIDRYPHNCSETIISYSHGTCDLDGGSSTKKIEVDICPECFMGKLVPFLVENGADIVEQEEET